LWDEEKPKKNKKNKKKTLQWREKTQQENKVGKKNHPFSPNSRTTGVKSLTKEEENST
jgi:hypothetical protein